MNVSGYRGVCVGVLFTSNTILSENAHTNDTILSELASLVRDASLLCVE